MAKLSRKKTVGEAATEIRELEEKAAVQSALASYLRTRYLPRDSISAQAKLPCQGSSVSEAIIEEIAQELESGAKEFRIAAKEYESIEVTSG
jgi:hypothetical protein